MTRTGSCFVIEEYQKAYYKKVVEKIAVIVSYSERSSVTDKVSDFFRKWAANEIFSHAIYFYVWIKFYQFLCVNPLSWCYLLMYLLWVINYDKQMAHTILQIPQ